MFGVSVANVIKGANCFFHCSEEFLDSSSFLGVVEFRSDLTIRERISQVLNANPASPVSKYVGMQFRKYRLAPFRSNSKMESLKRELAATEAHCPLIEPDRTARYS